MKRFFAILALSLAISVLGVGTLPGQEVVPVKDAGTADIESVEILRAPMTPLARTIAEIRQATSDQVIDLTARIEQLEPGSPEILEMQSRIWRMKQDAEIAVLRAIVDDARARGDQPKQAEAEEALDRILHPEKYPTPTVRVDRAAPSGR